MMNRPAVCAAIAALFLSTNAHADVFVQTSVGKLRATVIDLDPNDGIEASIAFAPVSLIPTAGQGLANLHVDADMQGGDTIYSSAPTPTLGAIVDVPGRGTAAASLVDRPDPLQTTLAVGARVSHDGVAFQQAQAESWSDTFSYTLSPHTSLVFSLPGTALARLDDNATERLYGYAVFGANLSRPDGFVSDSGADRFSIDRQLRSGTGAYLYDDDFELTVRLSNPSGDTWHGDASFGATAWASADPMPAPVPEPSGAAMLAAGVGLLAWRGRRRS